jgi:hypothetical protein
VAPAHNGLLYSRYTGDKVLWLEYVDEPDFDAETTSGGASLVSFRWEIR